MNSISQARPIEILLVEDSSTDVLLAQEALELAKMSNRLNIVKDGVEAMAYLRKEGKYADVLSPDLILLDLNLPRKDGREVLAEVKADPVLKCIPVVVLTTSKAQEDVLNAYGLHANCYITKPVDFEQFANVVRAIDQFWFTVVTLPTVVFNGG
jgi:chemotaxis family two-component system response regulator Rcp1